MEEWWNTKTASELQKVYYNSDTLILGYTNHNNTVTLIILCLPLHFRKGLIQSKLKKKMSKCANKALLLFWLFFTVYATTAVNMLLKDALPTTVLTIIFTNKFFHNTTEISLKKYVWKISKDVKGDKKDKPGFQFYKLNTFFSCWGAHTVIQCSATKTRMILIRIGLETKVKPTKLFLFPRGVNHQKL